MTHTSADTDTDTLHTHYTTHTHYIHTTQHMHTLHNTHTKYKREVNITQNTVERGTSVFSLIRKTVGVSTLMLTPGCCSEGQVHPTGDQTPSLSDIPLCALIHTTGPLPCELSPSGPLPRELSPSLFSFTPLVHCLVSYLPLYSHSHHWSTAL